ncbi:MAG TPA: acyl-CoA dehydrogenase family protein [Acidimicrobiales bacterium]|nr:acyl-CoA dehydrogenase family protein [Acidimicrobiales bacterium]
MLELDLSEEQEAIRAMVTRLGMDTLAPASRSAQSDLAVPPEVWRAMADTGLVAPVPAELGGGGVPDVLSSLIAAEGLAHGDAAIAMAAIASGAAAVLIGLAATDDQQASLLPPVVADNGWRGSVALYEGFGRAPSEYRTTVRREGSTWRVTGRKVAVPFGSAADVLVVVGTDPSTDGRLRAALVPARDPGILVQSVAPQMGLEAAPLSTIELDVAVPDDQIVGGASSDPGVLSRVVSRLRLLPAAVALGAAQRAREYAAGYANERVAFGRPISSFQGVSFLMAEAQVQIDAARLEIWKVASSVETADPATLEAAVSRAVSHAGSVAAGTARDALQVLGGHGFITDHPVERWYRATASLGALDFDPMAVSLASAL